MLMILKYHFKINLGPGPAKVPGFFISYLFWVIVFFIVFIGVKISVLFLSGANSLRDLDDGNSKFTLILSTKSPAFLISVSSLPGIAFKWIYPPKLYIFLSL